MSDPTPSWKVLSEQMIGTIDRVELLVVRIPFGAPFAISSAVWTAKEALLLRFDGEGLHPQH